jgi:hypothetical protein
MGTLEKMNIPGLIFLNLFALLNEKRFFEMEVFIGCLKI